MFNSKALSFLAAVLPLWVEYVAVAEVKVTAYWVMVEEVVDTPLLIEVQKALLTDGALVCRVPYRTQDLCNISLGVRICMPKCTLSVL